MLRAPAGVATGAKVGLKVVGLGLTIEKAHVEVVEEFLNDPDTAPIR